MTSHQTDHTTDIDQTDHHVHPYKHEIHVSVGDDSKHQAAVITPTPSPRSTKSTLTSEVASTHSDDHETLTRAQNGKDRNGVDNPAFETDKTSPRPLSSFGHNGMTEINLKEPSNGKSTDKPLGKHSHYNVITLPK